MANETLKDKTVEELRAARDAKLTKIYDSKAGKPPVSDEQKELDRRVLTSMLNW